MGTAGPDRVTVRVLRKLRPAAERISGPHRRTLAFHSPPARISIRCLMGHSLSGVPPGKDFKPRHPTFRSGLIWHTLFEFTLKNSRAISVPVQIRAPVWSTGAGGGESDLPVVDLRSGVPAPDKGSRFGAPNKSQSVGRGPQR